MINTNLFRSACSACSASPQLTALDRQKFDSWLRGKSKLMPVLPKKTKGEEPLTVYDFEINTATLVWVKFVRYVIRLLVVLVVYHSVPTLYHLCTHSVPTLYHLCTHYRRLNRDAPSFFWSSSVVPVFGSFSGWTTIDESDQVESRKI